MSAGLLSAALAETALVTYREFRRQPGLPLPSVYASVALVYGGLGLLPDSTAPLASLVGWGFVVATFLNLYNPSPACQGAP